MKRILHVALRDFLAIVATRGFLIGLLAAPAMGAVFVVLAPILFDDSGYRIEGEYGVIDPTGRVLGRGVGETRGSRVRGGVVREQDGFVRRRRGGG